MYSFRKSKKGFTLIELMVVVAIIGVLALLGLRLFLVQQIRAKNAIVKANAATVHTIIQGNLADFTYSTALLAVNAIGDADGNALTGGIGTNAQRPAGMKTPHNTASTDHVVHSITTEDDVDIPAEAAYEGTVVVKLTATANKFYIIGLDDNGDPLGEQYVAQK